MAESGRSEKVVDGRKWYMGESARWENERESWERLVDKRKRELGESD